MLTYLIIYFVLSIAFSFLCSIWEAVLLSITPSYISTKVQNAHPLGLSLQAFKEDIDRPLSAILTLNTIAHTTGAIGVGAQAGKIFADSAYHIGPVNMEGIIASIMTLAILVLSEIIPKTLGANYWQRLVPFTVQSLKILLFLLAPFVWISQLITKNLKKNKSQSVFSRADFRALTQVGEDSGALKKEESLTIHNLLRLDQINVRSIMTPRSVMISADESQSLGKFYLSEFPLKYSRIPVFDHKKETVLGILLKDDLYQALIDKRDDELSTALMRKAVYINDQASLSALKEILISSNSHVAIVHNEYGAVIGLVTWEDLLETILGLEIVDETDEVADLQKMAKDIWEKRSKAIIGN